MVRFLDFCMVCCRKISLRGVAVECFPLEGLFGFRILPLPTSSSSSLDLATETGGTCRMQFFGVSGSPGAGGG